jgi:hypothetical protein
MVVLFTMSLFIKKGMYTNEIMMNTAFYGTSFEMKCQNYITNI